MPNRAAGMPTYASAPRAGISPDVRKRNTWLAIGISALILLALFFGLNAAGILKVGGKAPNGTSLTAKGQLPDLNLLQANGSSGPPTMAATRKTMPQDLRDWLEHLARCEKKKEALTGTQVQQVRELEAEMQGGADGLTTPDDVDKMTDPNYNSFPTLDKATAMLNQLQPDWVELKKEFDSVPPPEECKPIAESYDEGLSNIIDTFASIEKLVGGVDLTSQGSIKGQADKVKDVGLQHRRGIDGAFQSTDDLVQQICDKYDTKKWFKIDAHGGSAGLLGY